MTLVNGSSEKVKRTRGPEIIGQPEKTSRQTKVEKNAETETADLEIAETTAVETKVGITTPVAVSAHKPVAPVKNPELAAVEKILEENIGELYSELPPNKKADFRREGERLAQVIWLMLETAKIHVQKIVKLIRDWLKIIPGINLYFLEQESKIKTDKIIELVRKKKSG